MRTRISRLAPSLLFAVIAAAAFECLGESAGRANFTNKAGLLTCSAGGALNCHGTNQGANGIQATISGPPTLAAGQSAIYTVTATQPAIADGVKMGIDVASSDPNGALTVRAGQPTSYDATYGEITHNIGVAPLRTTFNGAGTYQFTYTMPASAPPGSTHRLYAAAVLGRNSAADAPNLTVTTATVTRYVDSILGNNTANNCRTAATPCKTITYAMSLASSTAPGETISVAPGLYSLASGEVFPIAMKPDLTLISSGAPETTIIDGIGDTVARGLITSNLGTLGMRIEGFTFRNGRNFDVQGGTGARGGAVSITNFSGGSFYIVRNIFLNNEARGASSNGTVGLSGSPAFGGALYIDTVSTAPVFNNVFSGNIARAGDGFSNPSAARTGNEFGGDAGGAAIYFNSMLGVITENTFYGNTASAGNGGMTSGAPGPGGEGRGGAVRGGGNFGPFVGNNLFVNNAANAGAGSPFGPAGAGAYYTSSVPGGQVKNNLFYINTTNGGASNGDILGTGSLAVDPTFHAAPGNLQLRPGTPALQAGTITGTPTDITNWTRPVTPTIGAYEPTLVADVRLGNISTRMQVLTGNDVLIGGFIIGGAAPKTVVVRARGPSLAPFGITNALANPMLQLFSGQTQIASNDDWASAPNAPAITSSGFAPGNALESAILATLSPGAYTAIVTGVGATTGVGIIEVFEVDHPELPLANISTRGQVLTGNDVMIGGFVIQGTTPQTVVVRARGPSLAPFGIANALANPVLQLYSGQTQIASNDDWASAANAGALLASGFAPSNALEAAILITLPPGAYTAIVSGVGGTTGVGIIEVFAQ